MYMYTYMYIFICIHKHICTSVYVFIYAMYVHTFVCYVCSLKIVCLLCRIWSLL